MGVPWQPTVWTEAKACKLFARGGEMMYDEMHNHCDIFAPNRTYLAKRRLPDSFRSEQK